MLRRFILLLAVLALGVLIFFVFRRYQHRQTPNALVYNKLTERFEPTILDDDLDRPSIRQQNLDNNADGLHNYTILKGYFQTYEPDSQILQVRSAVAHTTGNVFTLTNLHLPTTAVVTCVASTFTDRNTGRVIPSSELTMPVLTGETLTLPFEQPLAFDALLTQSNEQTFLFLQLTANFQEDTPNTIYKVIAMGLCD